MLMYIFRVDWLRIFMHAILKNWPGFVKWLEKVETLLCSSLLERGLWMNCQICNCRTDAENQSSCGAFLCRECLASCEERQGDCMACPAIE
jgi:hypothetical protein